MSPTGDKRCARSAYRALNCRTVKEIEEQVVEKGKRNRAYRLFHARNDKETITSWKSDLVRILGVFNVRSIVYVRLLLTVCSQAEVAIDTNANTSAVRRDIANTHSVVSSTHTIVSDIRDDVVSTQTTVSSIQQSVANTHTLVSHIYHNMLQSQGETGGQHHSVSATSVHQQHTTHHPPRLKLG